MEKKDDKKEEPEPKDPEQPATEDLLFAIMVDSDTLQDGSVILRNLGSLAQIRLPGAELVNWLDCLTKGQTKWQDAVPHVSTYGAYSGSELANKVTITYNKETNEFAKQVKYSEGADNEAPNDIYKKVFEDNKKFTFENDIYSQEFFDFILQITDLDPQGFILLL